MKSPGICNSFGDKVGGHHFQPQNITYHPVTRNNFLEVNTEHSMMYCEVKFVSRSLVMLARKLIDCFFFFFENNLLPCSFASYFLPSFLDKKFPKNNDHTLLTQRKPNRVCSTMIKTFVEKAT